MSDKVVMEENLDEIMKNFVLSYKNKGKITDKEISDLVNEAIESLEFTDKLDEIKLESPDYRVIFVEGNEELVYDHGEFFMCDTIDSKKQKRKLKRKEATELYIEFFIRYQLNQIIEDKNIDDISKTIKKIEVDKTKTNTNKQKEAKSKVEGVKRGAGYQKAPAQKKTTKSKEEIVR